MTKRVLPLMLSLSLCSTLAVPAYAAEADAPSYTVSGTVVTVEGTGSDSQYVTVTDSDGKVVGTGVVGNGSNEVYIIEGTDTSDLTVKNEVTGDTIDKKKPVTPVDPVDPGKPDKPSTPSTPSSPTYTDTSSSSDRDRSPSSGETSGPAINWKTGENGTVSISPEKPKKGDTVTITAAPADGYILGSITVTTVSGKNVMLYGKGGYVYTFTMPGEAITIRTSFRIPPEVPAGFSDVKSTDWFANAVAFVSQNGMMAGNNGRFSPNDSLTRGMMAQILYNTEGKPAGGSASFPDVTTSDWFAGAVSWAASQKYMDGYGSGKFGPNDPITREQLASILYRYAGAKGYNTSASAELSGFADGASTSDWANTAMRWAVGSGLLAGKSGNKLDPTGTATRAEVAQILMNFYSKTAV